MTLKEYKTLYEEGDPVGWEAIDKKLLEIYPDQEARHFAPPLHYMMGGEDPLDGTSIYDSQEQTFHRHFVSYGMSELYYNEEAVGGDFSKWGFEFTFRLKPYEEDSADPTWVINMMNNLARYVFKSGKWFEEYHVIPANGSIRLNSIHEIDIIGIAFAVDPELGRIQTPHGEVVFLQMVGLTSKEMERVKSSDSVADEVAKILEEMRVDNPLLITDLLRK